MAAEVAFEFGKRSRNHGAFTLESSIMVDVRRNPPSNVNDEQTKARCDIVRRLLAGERDISADFSNVIKGECEDGSYASITADEMFILAGGVWAAAFGGRVSICVSYSENKAAIDEFLTFMLGE